MQGYDVNQSSAAYPLVFLLIGSADHIGPLTGAAPTVLISKNGAAFAAPAGAVAEIGNGWYRVAGNATDTATLGPLLLHATATGADPTDACYPVVAYNPQAQAGLGLTNLDVPVSSRMATFATPPNFSALAITAAGAVTAGTVGDKAGYSLATAPPTAAAIATAVWQDATAGDFTAASSIGKCLYVANIIPGAAGGHFIAGANAATTVNFTGNLSGSVGSVSGAVGSVTGLTPATIATATWTDTTAGDFATAGSPGRVLVGQLGGAFGASGSVYTAAALANAPTGGGGGATPAQVATAVWQDLTTSPDFGTANSVGALVKANLDANVGSRSTFSLAQALTAPRALDTLADAAITANDALWGAACGAAGKETVVGTTYTVMTPSTGTPIRTFTLDSATAPTSRT